MREGGPGAIAARSVGVGFKAEHFDAILAERPNLGFFEVHAENYMGSGGPPHRRLEAIRDLYPLSLHGVGLSIGSPGSLDGAHLARLANLTKRYEPALVSEHLAWSADQGMFFNDLLPLPYTDESLARVCEHIDGVQSTLRRRILIENPSIYLAFAETTIEETEFLAEIVRRTGCGLLLDVNNLFVSSINQGFDARRYLARFPCAAVDEIHLAGCADDVDESGHPLLIDTHDSPVREAVLSLYGEAVRKTGPTPTLIEWDNEVPAWSALLSEADRAIRKMDFALARESERGDAA